MFDLQKPSTYKLVTKIVIFNFVLLFIDWILVYIYSKELSVLYEKVGLDAIFNIFSYYFKLRAVIIIVGSLAALFKFWEMKNQKPSLFDKWILRIAFILLITGSIAAIETFIETIFRFI